MNQRIGLKQMTDEQRRDYYPTKTAEWYQRHKKEICAKRQARYATDTEFRARILARARQQYATDPEYKARCAAYRKAYKAA